MDAQEGRGQEFMREVDREGVDICYGFVCPFVSGYLFWWPGIVYYTVHLMCMASISP